MPHQVQWLDGRHTMLRQVYTGSIDLSEFVTSLEQTAGVLNTVDYDVDVIIDVRNATVAFTDFIRAAQYANKLHSSNQRLVILVGADSITKSLVKMVKQIAHRVAENGHMVDTLDEARAIIADYRAGLEE